MTQTGPTDQYATDLFFLNKLAHLSLYQVLSRQSMCILCSGHISYSGIIIVIWKSNAILQSFIRIFAFFISHYMHE